MGKRRKKGPIPLVRPPMKSLKKARHVTSRFHKITHTIEQLERQLEQQLEQQEVDDYGLGPTRKRRRKESEQQLKQQDIEKQIRSLRSELDALGGREAYQQASVVTTARCSSSKWVIKTLRRRGVLGNGASSSRQEKNYPRVLEVGAINTELLTTPGLQVRAIDLLSRQAGIEQKDFFDLADEIEPSQDCEEKKTATNGSPSSLLSLKNQLRYDVIVVSMVINCVPTPKDRGRMLVMLKQMLEPGGLLFLTLPVSCLTPPAPSKLSQQDKMSASAGMSSSASVESSTSSAPSVFASSSAAARAAPGFTRAYFESLLTSPPLQFDILGPPDCKTTGKVAFYCLQNTPCNQVNLVRTFDTKTVKMTRKAENSATFRSFSGKGFYVVLPNTEVGA